MWCEEGIKPRATLIRLVSVRVKIARVKVIQRRAVVWILKTKGAVQILRLQEPRESGVDAIDG